MGEDSTYGLPYIFYVGSPMWQKDVRHSANRLRNENIFPLCLFALFTLPIGNSSLLKQKERFSNEAQCERFRVLLCTEAPQESSFIDSSEQTNVVLWPGGEGGERIEVEESRVSTMFVQFPPTGRWKSIAKFTAVIFCPTF